MRRRNFLGGLTFLAAPRIYNRVRHSVSISRTQERELQEQPENYIPVIMSYFSAISGINNIHSNLLFGCSSRALTVHATSQTTESWNTPSSGCLNMFGALWGGLSFTWSCLHRSTPTCNRPGCFWVISVIMTLLKSLSLIGCQGQWLPNLRKDACWSTNKPGEALFTY